MRKATDEEEHSQLESVVYASCGSEVTLGIKGLLEAVQRLPHSNWWQALLWPTAGGGRGSRHLRRWGSKCGARVVIDPGRKHKL